MRARLLNVVLAHGARALCLAAIAALILTAARAAVGERASASVLTIDSAQVVGEGADAHDRAAEPTLSLPDDWAMTRPRFDGLVQYRVRFDRPPDAGTDDLLVLYVERVCSNLEVDLNQQRLFSGGRMSEPVTIKKGSSSMVSIMNKPIGAEDVYLWRPDGNAVGCARAQGADRS